MPLEPRTLQLEILSRPVHLLKKGSHDGQSVVLPKGASARTSSVCVLPSALKTKGVQIHIPVAHL